MERILYYPYVYYVAGLTCLCSAGQVFRADSRRWSTSRQLYLTQVELIVTTTLCSPILFLAIGAQNNCLLWKTVGSEGHDEMISITCSELMMKWPWFPNNAIVGRRGVGLASQSLQNDLSTCRYKYAGWAQVMSGKFCSGTKTQVTANHYRTGGFPV